MISVSLSRRLRRAQGIAPRQRKDERASESKRESANFREIVSVAANAQHAKIDVFFRPRVSEREKEREERERERERGQIAVADTVLGVPVEPRYLPLSSVYPSI